MRSIRFNLIFNVYLNLKIKFSYAVDLLKMACWLVMIIMKKTMRYPHLKKQIYIPNTNPYTNFELFSSYLFLGTSGTTILYP